MRTTPPVDNYWRHIPPTPLLIRITGGERTYDAGKIYTKYSWTLAFNPQDTQPNIKPTDISPTVSSGPKASGFNADWAAFEASGSDCVPTDGSVVVLALPSPSQDYLIFHYEPKIFARIIDIHETDSTTWYSWQEVEPGPRDALGQTWTDKLGGFHGELSGGELRNPLFEVNQNDAVEPETIVEILRYPVRVDTGIDDGFLRDRPEAVATETQHASVDDSESTIQDVTWHGATGGEYELVITSPDGDVDTSDPIDFTDNAAAIRTAINACSNVTDCTVVGDGESFTVEFIDDFDHWPLIAVTDISMFADTPYFFDATSSGGGSRISFLAILGTRYLATGNVWEYAWKEAERISQLALPTVKSGGRVGYTQRFAVVERVVTGTPSVIEVQRVTIYGQPPTSGIWTFGGVTFSWDVDLATFQTMLQAGLGVAVSCTGSMTAGFTITWPAVGVQTLLTVSVGSLLPLGAYAPAIEENNQKTKSGVAVRMWKDYNAGTEEGSGYGFWKPVYECDGEDVSGFVAGVTNYAVWNSAGCLVAVQPVQCETPRVINGGGA